MSQPPYDPNNPYGQGGPQYPPSGSTPQPQHGEGGYPPPDPNQGYGQQPPADG